MLQLIYQSISIISMANFYNISLIFKKYVKYIKSNLEGGVTWMQITLAQMILMNP